MTASISVAAEPAAALRAHFSLDPDVIFLNHGSFGATPLPVQQAAEGYRRQMERQPVRFLQQELPALLAAARARLGAYLGAAADDLAFVPNATFGVNLIARALIPPLGPGDEVLTSNQEYGACSNAWEYACARAGARYVRCPLPLADEIPAPENAEPDAAAAWVERLWAAVTERTRVLYLSHITSPTAQRLPVEPLIARARAAGILTFIDGAHAPGMIPLDLDALGADIYTGNCHKWLCAPKVAGFLHVRPEQQHWVTPLVVSWGSPPERNFDSGNDFQDALWWSGTSDFSAYLAVPAAIDFQAEHAWEQVRARAAALLDAWLPRLADASGTQPVYPNAPALRPPQMAISPLPGGTDAKAFKQKLLDRCRIEVPVTSWRGRQFVRVSVQGYTSEEELAALEAALRALRA